MVGGVRVHGLGQDARERDDRTGLARLDRVHLNLVLKHCDKSNCLSEVPACVLAETFQLSV